MDENNTRFSYLYRDASNYKQANAVVVRGAFQGSDEEAIVASLNDEEYFIPRQIGLPEERFDNLSEHDHCWFEYVELCLTDAKPTIDLSIAQLVERFRAVGSSGWRDDMYAI